LRASSTSFNAGLAGPSVRIIDKYALLPILACVYACIAFPLILTQCSVTDTVCQYDARPENKIFWPIMALVSLVFVLQNFRRIRIPPNILCLLAYLAFAGMSVLWAFNPQLAFVRFSQESMIIICMVLPALLAARNVDMMRGVFLCFAMAALVNIFFVMFRPPLEIKFATWGYTGYFTGKNYLGECAGITVMLSLHELLHPGRRRALSIVVAIMALTLLIASNSKTALGLVILTPVLAWLILKLRDAAGLSVAVIVLSVPLLWSVQSPVTGFNVERLSYMLYGDPTFTGRTTIWDFAHSEIAKKPIAGWGYQSFWLAGPNAPSIVDAPGWVKDMPNAHNGYLDAMVELGYIGFILLVSFLLTTLHAAGRMADRDRGRAWVVLSIMLYIIITNGLESLWMRGFEFLWVVFVIVAAEVGRYWWSVPQTSQEHRLTRQRPGRRGARRPLPVAPRPSGIRPPGLIREHG